MRDTLNASDVELDYGEYRIIDLSNIPEFDIPDYDLEDPKELLRYLDDIKRICHNSRSYKKYTKLGYSPAWDEEKDSDLIAYLKCENEQQYLELLEKWKIEGKFIDEP